MTEHRVRARHWYVWLAPCDANNGTVGHRRCCCIRYGVHRRCWCIRYVVHHVLDLTSCLPCLLMSRRSCCRNNFSCDTHASCIRFHKSPCIVRLVVLATSDITPTHMHLTSHTHTHLTCISHHTHTHMHLTSHTHILYIVLHISKTHTTNKPI